MVRFVFTRVSGNLLHRTPDLGGPFPVAFLWDGKSCVLYPSCISGFPSWSLGGDATGKGCTFWCGWASDTLRSVVFFLPW